MIVKPLIVTVVVLFAILKWGRQIVNVLDKVVLSTPEVVPLDLSHSRIYGEKLYLSEHVPSLPNIAVNEQGQAVLSVDGLKIVLGETKKSEDPLDFLTLPISPEDRIQFSHQHSSVAWLTPFELNFMTGHSPYKKRNMYYTLYWKKKDGRFLRARWKFYQAKYKGGEDGWGNWYNVNVIEGAKDDLVDLVIDKN